MGCSLSQRQKVKSEDVINWDASAQMLGHSRLLTRIPFWSRILVYSLREICFGGLR